MTTDITELALSKSLRKKLNRRLNDAYGFQRTSGGKHTTISLSIAECKSVIAALGEHLALVEALEKKQAKADVYDMLRDDYGLREKGVGLADFVDWQANRIAELESRTVKLPKLKMLEDYLAEVAIEERKQILVGVKLEFHRACAAAGIKVEAE
ncbi:hypothetical protein [Klebsiella pneumoniae]|uniref:hypothetical protein n=1 Tax=Klebsiella pneumoniae TaxID=573 RepID=UPI000C799F26|nr:hypothetical protein [Klebsiella pneumoniae]PLD37288.1 hypothetical protein B6I52_04190 [Klebsiella pneumoniae]PLD90263.1 hypothetical protein B6I63_07460 [Klebsiella pneumoniae]